MTDEAIGIELRGGPAPLDGWSSAYSAEMIGGWPPPERLAALSVHGRVAVALVGNVPDDYKRIVTYYRKISQSELPDSVISHHIMRSAVYEHEPR